MVINELKELILNTINNINSKEKLSSFLDFMGKGNIYYLSLDNILAVYAQNSSAMLLLEQSLKLKMLLKSLIMFLMNCK